MERLYVELQQELVISGLKMLFLIQQRRML
jgi:hypothetical protein